MSAKRWIGPVLCAAFGIALAGAMFRPSDNSSSPPPAPGAPELLTATAANRPARAVARNDAASPDENVRTTLRRDLDGLALSDEQADLLIEANRRHDARQAELDRALDAGSLLPKEHGAQAAVVETEKQRVYEQVLGAEVYADFLKRRDEHYQKLERLTADWQLTTDELRSLYTLTGCYRASALDYRQRAQRMEEEGEAVDWDGVERNLREYLDQTERMMREQIGDARLTELKRSGLLNSEN